MSEKRKRNIIITVLSCIVLLMAVGYAAFQSVLNINGTSNITSNWDVEITGITKDKTKGNVTEISEPTFEKESATFNVGLESPGDYIYYKVAVTNKGTLAAIAKLGNLNCGDNSVLECGAYAVSDATAIIGSNTDLETKRLIIGPGETEYYNVLVKYKESITEQPTIKSSNIKLTLTYEQSEVGITHQTDDKCYTGKVLKNGTISITDYDKNCGTEVVIPETINGYTVTEIADGRWDASLGDLSPFGAKGITQVSMPNTITYIGAYAFRSNNMLSINLSNNLKYIGLEALANNQFITINLPSTLTTIGSQAFMSNHLTNIIIPTSVTNLGDGAFSGNGMTGDAAFIYARDKSGNTDNTILNSYAGNYVQNLVIPTNIVKIGYAAFRTVSITTLEIPSTVKIVDKCGFWKSNIGTLKLNEGLLTIGSSAFEGASLKQVNIPNSVTTIEANAFAANKLTTVTIGSGIKTIGTNAFQTSGSYNPITQITINKTEGTVTGSPWGATNATINWTA